MAKSFILEIVTPESVFLKEEVSSLVVPAEGGYLGILYNHMPLITGLEPGVVKYLKEDNTYYLAISSGFLELVNNKATILADAVERPEEIDPERAKAALERAVKRLQTHQPGLDVAKAELALRRSRARLKVVGYKPIQNKKRG